MRAPTPPSQTSSKVALLKKTYRASSARFRVQRQQRPQYATANKNNPLNQEQKQGGSRPVAPAAKTLSPSQSAANVVGLQQMRKDSLGPRMRSGQTQASMTTAAMTRATRPTTAGRP